MLSEETLRTQAATTFPLNALQMDGKTIGLVHDCACSVLPFSSTAYTKNVVNSVEEAAPFLDAKNVTREAPVKWCARVTVSVAASSPRHGLLLRNLSTTASSSHLLSAAGDKGLGDLERALAKVAEDKSLWSVTASSSSSAPACTSLQVYLMSEPVVPESISSTLNDLPAASSMSRGSATMTTTRVVLGNSPSDIIAALRDLGTALLTDNAEAFTDTEVCWPRELAFPVNVHTSDEVRRRTEHAALLLPNKGLLHHRDAISSWLTYDDLLRQRPSGAAQFRTGEAWEKHLVTNPHTELPSNAAPALAGAETLLTSGAYDYYHYRVDGFKDDGWGCAYRSLQTVLSWFQHAGQMAAPVPSLRRIQEILSAVDPDKANKKQFVGSCDWIGSFEIMLVLQHYMPGLDCTIRRMESGKDLETDPSVQMLLSEHFRHPNASPVMIGGSSYAHTILGIHVNVNTMEVRYLILDPHYTANPTQIKTAIKKGYVGWKEASSFFEAASWYNLCIPRTDTYDPR